MEPVNEKIPIAQPGSQDRGDDPDQHNHHGGGATLRADGDLFRFQAELGHQRAGDERYSRHDPDWHHDKVVQVAEDRYEVWNEIDWRKSIGGNHPGQKLRIPGRAPIACRQPESDDVALDPLRPRFQASQQLETFLSIATIETHGSGATKAPVPV